jgi:hypothetical protein
MVGNLGVNLKDADRLAEAIPLLEETYRASKLDARLGFVGPALLDAYTKASKSDPENIAKVAVVMQERLASVRAELPKDSLSLAGQLDAFGLTSLELKAWAEAETMIREALTIREAKAPDDWRTHNTKSLLGGALLGQQKYAEAEPLLLDGYEGMNNREKTIPPPAQVRLIEAVERLVELYSALEKTDEVKRWQVELDQRNAGAKN